MIRLLYKILFPLALIVVLPRYLARMFRRGDFRRDFGQRFGCYAPELRAEFSRGPWLWVHAVSVGELLVALKILDQLHARNPAWRFVVSSTTSTAHALAVERQAGWWVPVYTPVDFGPAVRRALAAVKPRAIVLTESEMWPNFIWTAAARGLPVVLVNARVSPRSARRYQRFARFVRPVTRHLSAVGLQEPTHAALWSHLGVPADRLHLTGSVKFDPVTNPGDQRDFQPVLRSFGFPAGAPVLLAGSTHDGEEEALADSLRALRDKFPTARLVIVPRHVERTSEIMTRLQPSGFSLGRRTMEPGTTPTDILLVDTTGELRDWYACADVVFIGKSLTGRGGQNPVEAILADRPVLFGPHMENFADLATALLTTGGGVAVADAASLAAEAAKLLADPAQRTTQNARARAAVQAHQGATERTAQLIEEAVAGSDSAAPGV
ncbi:MAG: 3-deoxy-D-manno-octulosonic acid transferase [Chthoniobacterales bacterium]